MRNFLIRLLSSLLGIDNTNFKLHSIGYLFGLTTMNHEARKKRWKKALIRLWKDKDLLDYFYYQAEADKENIFKGKVRADLSRGARLRTLFFVHDAQQAFLESLRSKRGNATDQEIGDNKTKQLKGVYKSVVDVE